MPPRLVVSVTGRDCLRTSPVSACRRHCSHGHQGRTLMRFESGNTFGKNGRPRAAKNKLHRSFVEALAKDFEEHGEGAIRICRVEEPTRYLQIIASILPKEFLFENVTGD